MTKERALSLVKIQGFDIKNMTLEQEEAVVFLQDLEDKINKNIKYLNSTDFYYVRKIEENIEVPDDVISKRAEAKEFIRNNEIVGV